MSNIWFTSDTHYHHKNICRGVSSWHQDEGGVQRTRNFETIEAMNEAIVNGINNNVAEDDILYHLGDWSFGGFERIAEFRNKINCKNVHLIYGNHDHHIERNRGGVQGLFKSCSHYKEIIINNQRIILCHFAMRVWNKSHHGSWMLYGHSHGTLDEFNMVTSNPTWIGDNYFVKNYKTMDVGVDTNNLIPYNFDEIKEIMDKREVLLGVDHHSSNTN